MAQEPDSLTSASGSTAAGGTADSGDAGTPTPAEIERDIERTRADMTETIDALGARFEPSYLKEQAQDAIVETARTAGTSMIDTLKDNPLPAAIAGLSIAWLFANRSSGSSTATRSRGVQSGRYAAYGDYSGGYGASGSYRGATAGSDGGPSLVDKARDAASGLTDKARDAASGLTETVSETASGLADQARTTAHGVTSGAQDVAQRAETWLEGQLRTNPLGVGAVALAAGALVGLSLPTTEAEQSMMGAPAAKLVGQARDAADERLDQAKQVASKVADEARGKAAELVETVKAETGNLAETAKDAASEAGIGSGSGSDGKSADGSESRPE